MLLKRITGVVASPRARARLGERAGQRAIAGDHEVRAEQQVRLRVSAAFTRSAKKPTVPTLADREHQRGDQHAQLARAPVAPQHPQCERSVSSASGVDFICVRTLRAS